MKELQTKLIADGTIDLIKGLKSNDFKKVNVHIFSNSVEIKSKKELFKLLKENKLFTTSQPSPEEYVKAYQSMPKNNLIVLTVSKQLSGSYNSAINAKKIVKRKNIEVIDSKAASIGLGLLAREVVKLINQGLPFKEIISETKKIRDKMRMFVIPYNLNYLVRSGRLPKAIGLLGKLINLKPIIELRNGEVKGAGKMLVFNQLITETANFILKQKISSEVFMIHNNLLKETTKIAELLKSKGLKVNIKSFGGLAISAHVGPKAIGFCWIE